MIKLSKNKGRLFVNLIKNWNKTLYYMFSGLFLISFLLIIFNVIFNKTVHTYNTFFLLLIMAFFTVLMIVIAKFLAKKKDYFEKNYKKFLFASCAFLFCAQIVLGFCLQFDPMWDLEAIYQGAISWAERGSFSTYSSNTCHEDYFYIFPNNLGAMAFLTLFFKLANLLGIQSYFTVASILNIILIISTMLFAQAICKHFYGATGGILCILLFLFSFPFYFMAPVFYTDTLSMAFLLGAFYGLLKAENSLKTKQKICWYLFAAFLCLLGAMIKMTVLVFVIAGVIYFFLKKNWHGLLSFLMITIMVVGLGFTIFNSLIYSTQLHKPKAEAMNMPVYYWVDLAVHNEGRYDNNIFSYAINQQDPTLRKELLINDIKNTIKKRGVEEMYQLFETKSAIAFGDGTYALSDFLDDRPLKENTFLHDLLLYNGKYYKHYSTVTTAIFLAIQILMLWSVSLKKVDFKFLVPQLCVFGLMVFLMFWEINSRYIITIIPCIFICAVGGLLQLSEQFINFRKKNLQNAKVLTHNRQGRNIS